MTYKVEYSALGAIIGLAVCFFAAFTHKIIICIVFAIVIAINYAANRKSSLNPRTVMRRRILALIVSSALAASMYSTVYSACIVNRLNMMSGNSITIVGRVIDYTQADNMSVTVKGKANGVNCKMTLHISGFCGDYGDLLTAEVSVKSIPDDSRSYNYSKGIYVNSSSAKLISIEPASGKWSIYNAIRNYSDHIYDSIRRIAGRTDSGELLCAMLCGRPPVISQEMRQAMNRSGIGHMMSVSGLHVSIISCCISAIICTICTNRYLGFALSEIIMIGYVVFSGIKVSAVRAFIMMSIYLISRLIHREYSIITALSVCFIVFALYNPYSIGDVSFLLSAAGVFGVSVASKAICTEFCIKSKISKSAVASVCALICTMPIAMFCFDEISIASVITNIVLVPICSAALCLCMVFALMGGAPVLSFIVESAAFLAGIAIDLSELISSFRISYIPVKYRSIAFLSLILSAGVILIYASLRNIRKTAFAALSAFTIVITASCLTMAADANTPYADIITADGEFICVVHRGSECIVIDSNSSFSDECTRLMNREGITQVSSVFILDNGVSGYTAYKNSSIKPRSLIIQDGKLTGDDQVTDFNGTAQIKILGTVIDIINGETVIISFDGTSICVSKSYTKADTSITVVNGAVVINEDQSQKIVNEDNEFKYKLRKK